VALEAADRFAFGLALAVSAVEMRASCGIGAGAGERDDVLPRREQRWRQMGESTKLAIHLPQADLRVGCFRQRRVDEGRSPGAATRTLAEFLDWLPDDGSCWSYLAQA
jgi:hypothetical protein